MKRFGFRLQKVLNYRGEVERQRQMTLARAAEAVRAREREVRKLEDRASQSMEEMRKLGRGKVDVGGLRQEHVHLGLIRRETREAKGQLRVAETESGVAREGFLEARKGRKALEVLRTQRAAEYGHEADLEAQKELDEISARPSGSLGGNPEREEGSSRGRKVGGKR